MIAGNILTAPRLSVVDVFLTPENFTAMHASSNETTVTPHRTNDPKNSSFDLDDAFSDGDSDHDLAFELSSAAIREELARHHSLHGVEDKVDLEVEDASIMPTSNGTEERPLDTSVSTIDIGGPAIGYPPSPPSSLSRTPEESERSNEFSQVDLSEDLSPDVPDETREPTENGPSEIGDLPHPKVHIDASKLASAREELAPANVSLNPPLDPSTQDIDYEKQPPDSAPASSSSHEVSPPPVLSPVPTSPVTMKPGHRHIPSRSVGPSALEKVVNKTRPAYLPPKPKEEDNKHMADWENMMKLSRATGKFLLIFLAAIYLNFTI
jgi:hypothetical protein